MEVGNHSWSHPSLDTCSLEKIESELGRCQSELERILGRAPSWVAYPNGGVDHRVVAVARRLGFRGGFLFDHAVQSLPAMDPLRLSRIRIDASAAVERLKMMLSGIHPALHSIRLRLRGAA